MKRPDRLLVFTGDGKGKTTAALGMALRAAGHGIRVRIVQFVKRDASTGEIDALGRLPGVEIVQCGLGFVPRGPDRALAPHREAARQALELAREALASGCYGLVILDEVNIAVSCHLVDEEAVAGVLAGTAPGVRVVLTGRGAPPRFLEMADTVTEMRCVKHAFQTGVPAQQGVEY